MLSAAAVFLGLAVLAKGLVPLALFLPLVWAGRKQLRGSVWVLPLVLFLLTSAPWYIACWLRNGPALFQELFWRHHVDRFAGGVNLHRQPFWFYLPVLVAGLFPWSPVLISLFRRRFYQDPRRRFLLLWAVFGFLLFSISAGKLPGYLLPLFPALAALAGLALDEMKDARWLLAGCSALLMFIPVAAGTLPHALADGLSRTWISGWNWYFAAACLPIVAGVLWLERSRRRGAALGLLFAAAVAGVVYVKVQALPEVDRLYSARSLWRQVASRAGSVCVAGIDRNWRYGLNYYSVTPLPECEQTPRPSRIVQSPGLPPRVD
jgi:4-amino-4-deoxy-L-arabinose transferase-like glycosyltransferase